MLSLSVRVVSPPQVSAFLFPIVSFVAFQRGLVVYGLLWSAIFFTSLLVHDDRFDVSSSLHRWVWRMDRAMCYGIVAVGAYHTWIIPDWSGLLVPFVTFIQSMVIWFWIIPRLPRYFRPYMHSLFHIVSVVGHGYLIRRGPSVGGILALRFPSNPSLFSL